MGRSLAISAVWFTFFSTLVTHHVGSVLASERPEAASTYSVQAQDRFQLHSTDKESLEGKAGFAGPSGPPLLERLRFPTEVDWLPQHDVDVFTLQNSKPPRCRHMSPVSLSLGTSMEAWSQSQQKSTAEAAAQESQGERDSCGDQCSLQGSNKPGHESGVQLLSIQCTLDSHDATSTCGSPQRRQHGSSSSSATRSTEAASGSNSTGRGGTTSFENTAGAQSSGSATFRRTGKKDPRAGGQIQACCSPERTFSRTPESPTSSQGSGEWSCRKDQAHRRRVEQVYAGAHEESTASCFALQGMPTEVSCNVSGETERIAQHQTSYESCFGHTSGTSAGISGIFCGSPRHCRATSSIPTNDPRAYAGTGSGDDFRRRNGRGTGTRCKGRPARKGWQSETQKVSCGHLSNQGSTVSFEAQAGRETDSSVLHEFVHMPRSSFESVSSDCDFDLEVDDPRYAGFTTSEVDFERWIVNDSLSQCMQEAVSVDALVMSLKAFESQLDDVTASAFPWTDAPPVAVTNPQNRRVSFHSVVQVGIFHQEEVYECALNLETATSVLRRCWSFYGCGSSMKATREVLAQQAIGCALDESSGSNDQMQPAQVPPDLQDNPSSEGTFQVLEQVYLLLGPFNRVRRIETWLLIQDVSERCLFSRTVSIMPGFTWQEFEGSCRRIWHDLIQVGPIQWHVVRNSPSYGPSTSVHLIMVQNVHRPFQAHLMHFDQWPILGKFRAVIGPEVEQFRHLLHKAGARLPRSVPDATFAGFYNEDGIPFQIQHDDQIYLASSNVIYAHVRYPVIHADVASDQSSVYSNASTADHELELSDDSSDEFSWVTSSTILSHYDANGPFPWEDPAFADQEDDLIIDDEPDQPLLELSEHDRYQMQQHALLLRTTPSNLQQTCVAITFGVGLVELGRRDLDFTWEQIDSLPEMICQQWHEHLLYGDANLYFVNPQPEGLHVRPYIVFLVSIDYGQEDEGQTRKVLVREASEDASVVTHHQPFGAVLYNNISPYAVMSQLGHHECFPAGIRDCQIRLAGTWLYNHLDYEIPNGALCDAYIGPFPEYVGVASQSVWDAECLFRRARSHFQHAEGSTMMVLRVHGVSPANNPLGYRDYPVDYPDLLTLSWIDDIKRIWPFDPETAICAYVPGGHSTRFELDEVPIVQMIVSYVTTGSGIPILVRQRIHSVEETNDLHEAWAVMVDSEANDQRLRAQLSRHPFWLHPHAVSNFYREGASIKDKPWDWRPGDTLDLKINVHTREHMLIALLEMEADSENVEMLEKETVSLLQFAQRLVHPDASGGNSPFANTFQEICLAICQPFMDSSCYTEDNSNLRSAASAKLSLSHKEDGLNLCSADGSSRTQHVVKISLEHTLLSPAPSCNEIAPMFQVFDDVDVKHRLCQAWPGTLSWLPEGMHIHPATWEALHQQVPITWDDFVKLELYVDGATCGDEAAWAVVVIAQSLAGECCCGVLAGVVSTDPNDVQWLGARRPTNITAEVTALIIAQAYALTFPPNLQVCIRPDLRLSKQVADLNFLLKTHPGLAALSACLSRLTPNTRQVEEVRAHRHHPWNELADQVAKSVAKTGGNHGFVPWDRLSRLAHEHQERDWLWLQEASPSLKNAFPPLIENMAFRVDEATTEPNPKVCEAPPLYTNATCNLKACTINVLALDESEAKLQGTRVLRLDSQLHDLGISVACLQEARTLQGQRVTDHFRVFSSGGTGRLNKQFLGCEIWLHRHTPLMVSNEGKALNIQDFSVSVTWADDRRLVLRLSGPADLLVASIHAPCLSSKYSIADIQKWWTKTNQILQDTGVEMKIIGCDANAPLASHACSHFGLVGAEPQNEQGEIFERSIQECSLAVPSTFPVHEGPHGTWQHPAGKLLRRDYMILSLGLLPTVVQSQVLCNVDLGFSHVDHYPVMCHLKFALSATVRPDRIRWDRTKLSDPHICAAFQQDIAGLPIPRWDVDIDTHNDYFNHNVLAIAARHFQSDTKKGRTRPQLRPATLSLIAFKRQLLQWFRNSESWFQTELKAHLKQIERQLRTMILQDQKAWYDHWVEAIDLQSQQHNTREVYQMLCRLGRKKKASMSGPRPLPLLEKDDGTLAQSPEEMQSVWCAHFAQTEAGLAMDETDLVDLHLDGPQLASQDLDPTALPSLNQVRELVLRMKNGRVAGPNQLVAEVLKAGGDALATQMLPLVSKATLRSREPLSWKGGILIPLFKQRGSPKSLDSYRSIYLSDTTAKLHHSWIRRRLEAQWLMDPQAIQLGGKKGVGSDIAHHVVQGAVAWAKEHKRALSLLFLDLRAAFYSVMRSVLVNGELDDRLLCFAMRQHGILPDDWHRIRAQIDHDCATHGISLHTETMLRDMFSPTYFRMAGVTRPTMTCRGTRPGDPVGDILFNMAFQIILCESRKCFTDLTGCQSFGHPQPMADLDALPSLPDRGMLDLAYVDDAVFAVFTPDAQELPQLTQLMASVVHDTARLRGLDVNYGTSKTEAIMTLVGRGSRSVKNNMWHELHGKLPVVTEHTTEQMNLVRAYKHLGTVIQEHGLPAKEVNQRIAAARQAQGTLHRSFYAKKGVSLQAKKEVFRATVCTKHLFHAHTWSCIDRKLLAKWEDGLRPTVYPLCKFRLRRVPHFQLPTKHLFALADLLPPLDQLHVNRLKYCKRLLAHAPQCLWSMLLGTQGDTSWIAQLQGSVAWLRRFGPQGCQHWPTDPRGILTCISIDGRFQSKVTAAQHSCMSYRQQTALAQVRQLDFLVTFRRLGVSFEEPVVECTHWQCMTCLKSFSSKTGLPMHAVHMHGYKRKAKFWVAGDECLACNKKFFTRTRALVHVQACVRCFDVLQACFPPMTDDVVAQLDHQDRLDAATLKSQGWLPTKALLPVLRIPGACLPAPGSLDALTMFNKWSDQCDAASSAFQNLEGVCLADEPARQSGDDEDKILGFVGNSAGGSQAGVLDIFRHGGLAQLCAQLSLRAKVFLHVFSGFRRQDDLQDQLERMSTDGTVIHCVSLDICLARAHADLMSGETLRFWRGKMHDGWVAGVGGGPPCETFTAARYEAGGPPPLRSYDEPWGLPSLTPKQWKQTATGTQLVFALLELLITAIQLGLSGFLEHPAFPIWARSKRPASVWAWRIVVWLSKLPCVDVLTLDQCVYGCLGRKPTTLLTVRMPQYRQLVFQRGHQGRCPHNRRHTALIGKDETGQHRTQHAKIYPPLMNQDLAKAISEHLKTAVLEPRVQVPEFLADHSSHDFVDREVVQRDYHGWAFTASFAVHSAAVQETKQANACSIRKKRKKVYHVYIIINYQYIICMYCMYNIYIYIYTCLHMICIPIILHTSCLSMSKWWPLTSQEVPIPRPIDSLFNGRLHQLGIGAPRFGVSLGAPGCHRWTVEGSTLSNQGRNCCKHLTLGFDFPPHDLWKMIEKG